MHFTVLSAIPVPRDITAVKADVPVEDVANFAMRKFSLASLSSHKPMPAPDLSAAGIDQERWECLVETLVRGVLAPYDQNTTDLPIWILRATPITM